MVKDINSGNKIKALFQKEWQDLKRKFKRTSKNDVNLYPPEGKGSNESISSVVHEEVCDLLGGEYEMVEFVEDLQEKKESLTAKEWITNLKSKFGKMLDKTSNDITGSIKQMAEAAKKTPEAPKVSTLMKMKQFFPLLMKCLVGVLKMIVIALGVSFVLMFSNILIILLILSFLIGMVYRSYMKLGPIPKVEAKLKPSFADRLVEDWKESKLFLNAFINSSEVKNRLYILRTEAGAAVGTRNRSTLHAGIYGILDAIAAIQKMLQ